MLLLEGVGDVLEEDQAEDDVLVLGGVHVAAQRVGGVPEFAFKTEVGGGVVVFCHASLSLRSRRLVGECLRVVKGLLRALCDARERSERAKRGSVRLHKRESLSARLHYLLGGDPIWQG